MTEADLRAFKNGDEQFFRRAVADHSRRLLAYVRGYVQDQATAEDLVQETWLRAYRQRSAFRGDGAFVGWLLAVSRSVALDHLRRSKSATRAIDRVSAAEPPPTCVEPTAPTQLETADRAHRLRSALTQLPPRQRDTVVLRLLEDRSVHETALAMGCAEGTVKAALSQAMTNLRALLRADRKEDVS